MHGHTGHRLIEEGATNVLSKNLEKYMTTISVNWQYDEVTSVQRTPNERFMIFMSFS